MSIHPELQIRIAERYLVNCFFARRSFRRSPLDLALDFFVSTEGSFIRGALVSDLRRSATRSFRRRLPSRLGFKSEGSTPSASGICGDNLHGGEKHASEAQGARRSSASASLDSGDCHSATGHEAFASLRTSRRALMRQVAQGVLRRPALVLRGCAATLASCVRAACRVSKTSPLRHLLGNKSLYQRGRHASEGHIEHG